MKILDNNPESNGWTTVQFCTGYGWDQNGKIPCGRKLEVAYIDLQYRKHTDISGTTDRYYGFTCPCCGCFTEIPENKIPYNVRAIANHKPYIREAKNAFDL